MALEASENLQHSEEPTDIYCVFIYFSFSITFTNSANYDDNDCITIRSADEIQQSKMAANTWQPSFDVSNENNKQVVWSVRKIMVFLTYS